MAFFEELAGGPAVDVVGVDFAGLDQGRLVQPFAEAGADHAVAEALGKTVGPDVDQLGGEVGVSGARCGEELCADRAGDFGVLGEWLGGVDQYVIAALDGAVVIRAADLGERGLGDEGDGAARDQRNSGRRTRRLGRRATATHRRRGCWPGPCRAGNT